MTSPAEAAARMFSLHDSVGMQDPYPLYAELRADRPIAHSDQFGGFYFVTRFDAAKQVYSDFRHFSSRDGTAPPAQPVKMYPVDLDPPEQTRYRRLLNPAFTPEAIALDRPRIDLIVDDLIDTFIGDGVADLEGQLIRPALSAIVLPMLGAPLSDRHMVSEKLDYLTRSRGEDPQGCARVGAEVAAYLIGLSAERRRSEPRNDILQMLLGSRVDGEPLCDDQIFRILIIILFGGLDTTSAAVGEALVHLARNRADIERLRSGQVAWPTAIEEFIRHASPVQGLRRTVVREIELEGATLMPGDIVLSIIGSANRDPDRFAEPHRCMIDRQMDEHLAFGAGAHICLGRNLARAAMESLIKAVLTRLADYTVADDFVPEYAVGESRGMKTLPVSFTPGAVVGKGGV